ncbi:unnamed protein product [Blepharisma stoltei]|uniref:Vesicle transport protein USE1 n=1 Tax=Blepharisma stoltei TaxID=1481888 RepID=A0AAU9J113_9CILI|nr:unnamed protein product [Blepharisma stoltei]
MPLTSRQHRDIVNIFRFAKRLEEAASIDRELLCKFEGNLLDIWICLNPQQRAQLESQQAKFKSRVSTPNSNTFKEDRERLLGITQLSYKKQTEFNEASRLDLEREILNLAKDMKSVATSFKVTLENDDPLVQSIAAKQANFLIKMKKETGILDQIQFKTSWWASIKSFFALIFAFAVFCCMMVVIYWFPDTKYIYLKN